MKDRISPWQHAARLAKGDENTPGPANGRFGEGVAWHGARLLRCHGRFGQPVFDMKPRRKPPK